MRSLRADFALDRFFERVAASERRALFLDYDGTLAPFKVDRDEAVPYPGIREAITKILDTQGSRLVLISGRTIDDLIPLLGLKKTPEIWGSHGWEHLLPNNTLEIGEIEKGTSRVLEAVRINMEIEGLMDRCELKPGCLALHWRGLAESEIENLRDRFLRKWLNLTKNHDLDFMEFDGGIELRASGRDKASVIRTLLSEMSQDTVVAFLGDDMTDEEAFKEMGREDLCVLVRKEYRPTAADLWLVPPEEVLDFLARWEAACLPPKRCNLSENNPDGMLNTEGGVS